MNLSFLYNITTTKTISKIAIQQQKSEMIKKTQPLQSLAKLPDKKNVAWRFTPNLSSLER